MVIIVTIMMMIIIIIIVTIITETCNWKRLLVEPRRQCKIILKATQFS